MILTIHNDIDRVSELFNKQEVEDRDLHFWNNYAKVIFSNDKCALFFAKTGEDFWELHLTFDKSYRGKQAKNIIKSGIQWMLDNKTSRIICAISSDKLNIRMLARQVGFTKLGTENNKECYEIRRKI